MVSAVTTVQARIDEIRARILVAGGGVVGSSGGVLGSAAYSTTTDAADASAFSTALAGVTGTTAGTVGGTADGSADLGAAAVRLARTYRGVPYRWGGTDPSTGLDCSGFVQLVYGELGVDLPRVSRQQATAGRAVASLADARPGDLVFFGSPVHHVGIYVGDGKMIDAPHTGDVVRVRDVYETPSHIRRVTGGAADQGLDVPYAQLFASAGARYDVDPALLAAVAKAESGFNASATSPAGAQGLMQIMPGTARDLGVDATVPAQAVQGAARLLSRYLDRYDGSVPLALAAYNAGPGAVARYDGVPPYTETRTYVRRVTSYFKEFS